MRKLKLNAEALAVESFDAEPPAHRPRGTVQARGETDFLCSWQCTDAASCGWSEIDCRTQECRTDWNTCGNFGSCCPAVCE